jgi:hypothetical protein
MIVMAPEVDLVAGFDAQFVAKLLWDHDLALRADTMSHTIEYNRAGPDHAERCRFGRRSRWILCIHQERSIDQSDAAPTAGSVGGAPTDRTRDRGHSVLVGDRRARLGEIGA